MRRQLLPLAVSAFLAAALIATPAVAQRGSTTQQQRKMSAAFHSNVRRAGAHVRSFAAAPAANWTNLAAMKVAVAENGGAAIAGKNLYVPGGYRDPVTPTLYNHMQVYNTQTNKWSVDSQVMPAPGAVGATGWGDAAVCSDGKKIYVVNGGEGVNIYATMQIYDPSQPAGSRWSFGVFPSVGGNAFISQDSGCAWIGGKMYLFGGWGLVQPATVGTLQRITWVFDPATQTWSDTSKLILGTGALWFGYTNSKTTAFFAGGTSNLTTEAPSAVAESFTPAGGWVRLPNLPVPASANVAGLLAPGMGLLGRNIEVIGGGGLNTGSGTFFLQFATLQCAPGCTAWSDAGMNLNTARWFAASAFLSGAHAAMFDAGGQTAGSVVLKSAERTP